MTAAELGQWTIMLTVAMIIAFMVGFQLMAVAWKAWLDWHYRDNREIVRRMLGEKPRRGGKR